MGNNKNKNNKNKNKNKTNGKNCEDKDSKYPFVSVCTPTYNRRPFIASMIKCFEHQTYPKDRIEWIIIDDGTDKIEELVKDIPQVKYYKYDEKMMLGKKRNLMHEKSCGEIIVYMDDDDYYPPCRISHAVTMLQTHPKALCAGSSEIYIYFKHIEQMVQFGPYGPNHSTAGTFAFKRELLENNSYDDNAALAEERGFLKDYTVPFVQLEPKKTILVFSHIHNTFDKKTLLENRHPNFVKDSDKTVDDFIKDPELKDFYMNQIEKLLVDYEPGRPEMKPDVLKQIEEIKIQRAKQAKEMQQQQQQQQQQNPQMLQQMMQNNPQMLQKMMQQNPQNPQQQQMQQQQMQQQQMQQQQGQVPQIMAEVNGQKTVLSTEQIVNLLKQQQDAVQKMQLELQNKDKIIQTLQSQLE